MEPINTNDEALLAKVKSLEKQVEELQAREQAHKRAAEFSKVLHQTALALLSRDSIDDIMEFIVYQATEMAGTEHGFAHMIEDDLIHMHEAASRGLYMNAPMPRPHSTEGLVGRVIQTAETQIVEDYDRWEHRRPAWPHGYTRATLGVPMKANREVIGVLGVSYDEAKARFTPDVVRAIEALVDLASLALDKARLNADLRESQHFVERITETVPSILYVYDLYKTRNIYVNSALRRLLGYSEKQVREYGSDLMFRMIHPDDFPRIFQVTETLRNGDLSTNAIMEYRVRHASGEWRWFRNWVRVFRTDEDGNPIETVGIAQDITDQKQAEEELRYQAGLLETLADAVIAADKDFRIRSWNGGAEQLYGWTEEEVLGQRVQDILKSEAGDPDTSTIEARDALLETGRYAGEFITYRKDGTPVPIWTVTSLIRDEAGQVIGSVAVNRDVTEIHEAARALERNRHFLQSITDTAQMLIYAHSLKEHRNIFLNRYAREFFGAELSQQVQTDALAFFGQVLHPDHVQEFADAELQWQQTADNQPIHRLIRMKNAQGEYRWLDMTEVVLRRDEDGSVVEIMGTAIDVTEAKQVEDALRTSEERFRALFENSPIGVALIRIGGYILTSNPAMSDFLGYSADELKNMHYSDYTFAEDFENEKDLADQLVSGEISKYRIEKRYVRKDGHVVWGRLSARLFEIGGEILGVTMIEDINERKQAEEREQKMQMEKGRVQALAQFISDVSHDFRTPLSTMYTSMYMLQRVWDKEERRDHHMTVLHNQVAHLEKLVEGLFMMARLDAIDSMQLAPLNVHDLLDELTNKVRSRRENGFENIRCERDTGDPYIIANGVELHRALIEIINNAITFTAPDGEITLKTESRDNWVGISVIDNGSGVEPDDLPHVFERFYRADKARSMGGLGLGLSIAQKIVEKHHGHIEVDTTPGHGSTFTLWIPAAPR